jgi:hypothetical protein
MDQVSSLCAYLNRTLKVTLHNERMQLIKIFPFERYCALQHSVK